MLPFICMLFKFFLQCLTVFNYRFFTFLVKVIPRHFIFLKIFIYLFLERGEGREKERERNMCGCLSCIPPPGIKSTAQACALTRNWTGNLWLCGTMLNQLSHRVRFTLYTDYLSREINAHISGSAHTPVYILTHSMYFKSAMLDYNCPSEDSLLITWPFHILPRDH